MIIIASSTFDQSTNEVIDWLKYFNVGFIRINETSKLEINKIELSNDIFQFSFKANSNNYNSKDITGYWYRRGNLGNIRLPKLQLKDKTLRNEIKLHVENEIFELKTFFIKALEKVQNKIGSFYLKSTNKLETLLIAREVGFKIPETFIVNSKNDLLKINGDIITKSIQETKSYKLKEGSKIRVYALFTTKISENTNLPQKIFPTKIQSNIHKKIEIRTFFLNGKIFSMAIFSQGDKQTQTDFRRYNLLKPNRYVPYKLPHKIEKKVTLLMNKLKLNTGSLDIIKSVDNEFYFLEVNPIGQFGMVSQPCNYNLEKLIAENLR